MATRLFAWIDRPRPNCCASVAVGRMDDDVAMRVLLHDLASRGPSAPNQTGGQTNTRSSHNIYRASIASRDRNLVYLCVGHPRSLKMVPMDRRRNFPFLLFHAYLKPFPRYGVSKNYVAGMHIASRSKNLVYTCVVNNISPRPPAVHRELMVKQATACVWRTSSRV